MAAEPPGNLASTNLCSSDNLERFVAQRPKEKQWFATASPAPDVIANSELGETNSHEIKN